MDSSAKTPAREAPATAGENAAAAGGFVARLGGLTLLDLVQFACMRGGQRIFRVASRGQSGYLYFRGGNLVHAATAIASGVAAVREMLEWRSGSVESGMGGWPKHETITLPWRHVLLEAGGEAVAGMIGEGVGEVASEDPTPAPAIPKRSPLAAPAAEKPTVVLAPSGELLAGATVDGLPEAASYAAHMAELIGGFLGFDRFCALEANLGGEQLMVARNKSGNLLARREKDPAKLEDLRREVVK